MSGSSFGKLFTITTFGESHGVALGCIIDGVPPNLEFSHDDLQKMLDRRAPGKVRGVTSRKEDDKAEVLSGIFENKTLGTPIAVIVRNTNQRSEDYEKWKDEYRPGHADQTTMQKYGIRDYRGGGRSSGRETLARVIAGYFASLVLPNTVVRAYVSKMGPFEYLGQPALNNDSDFGPYNFPKLDQTKEIEKYLVDLKKNGESIGGQIKVLIDNCPAGLGEPVFDKLKADMGKAFLSIGACVGFSLGLGEKMATTKGSDVSKERKNFGGIEGGISNGERMEFTLTFKPTTTLGDKAKEGRHDPCILPRAAVVVEAMARIVLADHYLRQNAYLKV